MKCGLRRNGRSRESEAPLMRRGGEDGKTRKTWKMGETWKMGRRERGEVES